MDEPTNNVALSLEDLQKIASEATAETFSERAREGIPNYADFLGDSVPSYLEALGDEVTDFPSQVREILRNFVLLPRGDFQWPIVASYISLPLALCAELTKWDIPIAFSKGLSGSGKSTVGHILCELHKSTPISAGSSFAALRNAIKQSCFWDISDPTELDKPNNWKSSAIVWEDINPNELKRNDGLILNLLKNGVSRTGTVFMATLSGENLEFPCYAPKAISSIHPIYAGYEFRELVRRVIVFQHKPFKLWKPEDFSDFYRGVTPTDIASRLDFNWEDFNTEFSRFWNDPETIRQWVHVARQIRSKRKHGLEDVHWTMSKHLILAGVVCGYWDNLDVAIEHFREYWDWHRDHIEGQANATQKEIMAFLDEKLASVRLANEQLINAGVGALVQESVKADELKKHLLYCNQSGRLDTGIQNKEIALIMANLGWELQLGDWVRIRG